MIKVKKKDVMSDLSFSVLPLREELLKNLASLAFDEMTSVQAQSLPIILQGQDVIAQAKTGSGKTVAFGLGVLNRLVVEDIVPQSLILCPTRELAEQVTQVLRQLARQIPNVRVLNLSGGIPMKPQQESLKHGVHIIVGTPGRIKKHLDSDLLVLDRLQSVVLDEADRMLDMGFSDAISDIFTFCPLHCQTLLFSATYPPGVKHLATKFMIEPQSITAQERDDDVEIEQIFYKTKAMSDKFLLLKTLLLHHKPCSTLIFCNLKEQTVQLTQMLRAAGFSALALNGDMEQVERDQTMIRFKNQSCSIVVATDVAARGLDIKGLPAVINFELAYNAHVHIHRIGRTGRAGCRGLAISLATPEDEQRLSFIEKDLQSPLIWGETKSLSLPDGRVFSPEMVTLYLSAGRKDKIRPGDILGALTKDAGLSGETIGKIDIGPLYAYVAIHKNQVDKAFHYFKNGRLKGRKINVRELD
jgi:ATP-independent RNA helicase DbpA